LDHGIAKNVSEIDVVRWNATAFAVVDRATREAAVFEWRPFPYALVKCSANTDCRTCTTSEANVEPCRWCGTRCVSRQAMCAPNEYPSPFGFCVDPTTTTTTTTTTASTTTLAPTTVTSTSSSTTTPLVAVASTSPAPAITSSTVIGLAVGIPIVVLTLVGIGIALVYWLHVRGNSANEDVELPARQVQDDGAYGDVDAVRRGHVNEKEEEDEEEEEGEEKKEDEDEEEDEDADNNTYADVVTVRQGNYDAPDSPL